MWNENTGTARFYYSMSDITKNGTDDPGVFTTIGFYAWLDAAGLTGSTISDDAMTTKLFQQYVWPVFQDSTVGYIDVPMSYNGEAAEPTQAEIQENAKPLLLRLWQWLTSSKERYEALIGYYEQYKDKLMDSLTASTKTRFNDTPQAGGDFTADAYTTNATLSETSQDAATPMARLKEINDNLHNLYQKWADELRHIRLFVED